MFALGASNHRGFLHLYLGTLNCCLSCRTLRHQAAPSLLTGCPCCSQCDAVAPAANASPMESGGDKSSPEDPSTGRGGDAGAGSGDLEDETPAPRAAPVRDGEAVMVCLKRALKIAHAAAQQAAVAARGGGSTPAALYAEILNHYIYYFEQGLPQITPHVLQVCSTYFL